MKHGGLAVWNAMQGLVDQVVPALHAVAAQLPNDFPPRTWDAISHGMRAQARRFAAGAARL